MIIFVLGLGLFSLLCPILWGVFGVALAVFLFYSDSVLAILGSVLLWILVIVAIIALVCYIVNKIVS